MLNSEHFLRPLVLLFFSLYTISDPFPLPFFVFGIKPCENALIQAQPGVASSIRWRDKPIWSQRCREENGQISVDLVSCLVSWITSKRIQLQTWDWSSLKDICQYIMKNGIFQSEILRGLCQRVSKKSKMVIIINDCILCHCITFLCFCNC